MRSPSGRETPAASRRAGSSLALRNWRVRTRLIALVLVPTLAAVLLGGLRVATSIQSAAEHERVRRVAQFVTTLGDLAHQLDLERDLSVRYIANGRRGNQARLSLRDQHNAVDSLVQIVQDHKGTVEPAFRDTGRHLFQRLLDRLSQLPSLRQSVSASQLPVLPASRKYSAAIDDVLALFDESGQGGADETVEASASALASLTRAAEQASRQRGLLSAGLVARRFSPAELEAFNAARARQDSEFQTFLSHASLAEGQLYQDTVSGRKIDIAAALVDRVLELTRRNQPLRDLGGGASDVDHWFAASSEKLDRMHEVQRVLGRSIVDRAAALARAEQRHAALNVGVVILLMLLVLFVTTMMARSLVVPLRRLRGGALEIAGRRLPEMVQKLRESEGGVGLPEVAPIGVMSNDEVGEVARAFDEVHREAIRLANDEAQLRSNVSAMFVNLSRRTQTLVERQIALIDGLEQGEQDDTRLGDLFRLDHLATRMRRNSENLLVLAGQEPARRWSRPVPLLDVTRASLSEVENYERVTMTVPTGVSVVGQAVNDVIHLLAELVENAISFSPRETQVSMSANRIDGGGVMISITDAGIGMTNDEIAQTNWRLANPPVVDVSVSRRMGLFVVGRLALRNGIRVQLRRHDTGGLTAMVLLPEALMGMPANPLTDAKPGVQAFGDAGASAWSSDVGGQDLFTPSVPVGSAPDSPADPLAPTIGGFGGYGGPATGSSAAEGWPPGVGVPAGPPTGPPGYGTGSGGPVGLGGGVGLDAVTGPLPAARISPMEKDDEFLPIFASVESAWFRRAHPSQDQEEDTDVWQVPADAGWRAAAAAQEPVRDGTTTAGLPKRVPKANLVPGSANSAEDVPSPPPAMPALSPDRARTRLSSYQQGIRQGRAVARGEISEDEVAFTTHTRREQGDKEDT